MSLRFAIGILAVAALGYFVASAQAQQETFSATYQCIVGPPPVVGWTWTNTFTLDKEFLRLGDTLHGTLSSGYNYSACGGTGNSVPIDAFTRSQDWAVGNWVVTDSAGTHTYSSSNFAVINGTDGNYTGTFTYTPAYPPTNPPYPVQFVVGNGGPDNPTILWATFGPADNSPDLGSSSPRSGCEGICGSPINLASGNTWIQRQDYSLPGLGGGLQLTRTWNSMWPDNFPFQQLGMFGDSWQSTYEEHIQTTQAGANYWRADGSAWEFTYNSQTKAYTLASPLDARASLSFSSHTALFTVVLLDGSQRIFNSAGYLTALIDRNGNQVTVAHDSSNRITQVTDPAGRVLTFNYAAPNFPNLVSSTQDAVGNIATYAYDASGHLTSVTYADGSVVSYSYDGTGVILSVTDSQGKILESHTYDYLRRGLASARANGADRIAVSYDSQAATLQDSSGNLTTYGTQRIATRNYVSSIAGSGCDTCGGRGNYAFTYDSQGNRLTSTDPLGHLTKFAYDSNGDVTQKQIQSDSTGTNFQTWKYTYNSFGEVLTATDPLGNVTTNTYDSKGNLLTTTTPSPGGRVSGSKTSFAYDTKGELTTITDPLSHSTTIAYYTTGLVKSTTDAQSKVTQYQYDARGNRTAIIDANNQQTSFTYDVMNRLTKITYPTSPATFTQFGYDYRGRKTSVTDSNSKVTQYAYDDADRLVSVTDPNNGIIQYAYDNESNLTNIIDAAGNKTSFQYDSYGHVSQTSFPSSLAETYSYDLAGNLLTKTDRNGHVINYGYDVLNRLTSKSYPDSTAVNYTYDLANRLAQVSDPTGTYGFTYDNRSRLTQTSTTYSAISGKTFAVKYGYDAASNRTSMTDPQNAATSYVYDALNRLTTLAYPTSANYSFSYDALGRRTQLTRPNGIATNYQYDSVSRLLSVLHQTGSTVLDGATYQYDAAGNRTSKTDKRTNVTSTFSYDPLYELTQVLQGSTTTESYSYDAVGNRLSSLGVSPYSYNNSNELTSTPSATYTYDNNGNTLTKTDSTGTTQYAWDFENRLTSVLLPGSGGTVSFKYDALGRRIQKSSTSGTTNYVYDGANVLEEVDGSGSVLARYVQGQGIDEPFAEVRSGTTSYYEADGLGSITSLSNPSGALANTYGYDAFGKLSASSGTITNTLRYTGRELDSETGSYYYRSRYYDQTAGRFISEDALGGINRYPYVANNPISFADPLGLCKVQVKFWKLGPGYYHAYILTSDSQGTTYFRAGPSAGGPSSGASGAISSGSGGTSGRSCGSGSASPNSSNSSSPGSGGNGANTGPWGRLTAESGPYGPGTIDWDPGNPPSMTVVDDGVPCSVYNRDLAVAVLVVNVAQIPYNPFSTNSNAFANNALSWSGLRPGKPPVWVPGWSTTLP